MTHLLRSLLIKADAWSPRALLWVNIVLAGFVTVAHGGALLVANAQGSPDIAEIRSLAAVSLPLAALVLACSVLGLASLRLRLAALALQGAVFVFAVAPQLLWGVELLVHGIPLGNFAWSVGLFTVTAAYAVYVFSRYTVPARLRTKAAIYYSPLLTLGVAAVVDVGVFVRFALQLGGGFGA
jgi:hypothetical protein